MPKASRSSAWRQPGVALLLPAGLIALGAWQVTRVAGTAEDFTRRAVRVQASIERLQPLAARDPAATVRFNNDPQSYTAAQALGLMQETGSDLRRDAAIEQARETAAWATAGGGALALLAVLGCLAAASLGAWRGRRSRDALVRAFRVVVRLLPPLLGLVAVATSAAIVGAVLFEAGGVWFRDRVSTGEIKLVLAGLIVAAGAVWVAVNALRQLRRVLQAFTPEPMRVLGRAAGPDAAPGLWAFLRQVAAGQGAAVPDNVVLGMTDGFFVTSSPILLLARGACAVRAQPVCPRALPTLAEPGGDRGHHRARVGALHRGGHGIQPEFPAAVCRHGPQHGRRQLERGGPELDCVRVPARWRPGPACAEHIFPHRRPLEPAA